MKRQVTWVVLWALLQGCGSAVISAQGLSTTCSADADCVAVFMGDACQWCGCPNTAIATTSQAAYDQARAAAQTWCGPRPKSACSPCVDRQVSCAKGGCALQ